MLGLAPIAAAPLADDKKPLLRIQVSTLGAVALEGTSQARASTDGVSLVVTSPLRGAAGTFSKINAHSAGGFDMAGHAAAIGPLKVVAAEGFAVVTGATAGLETRVASDGSIALAAQGDARARSFGVVLSGLELRGAAAAKGTTAASGLGFVDMSGRAGGEGILQTSAAGSITLARQLAAEGGVEGAAARKMGLGGTTEGVAQTRGVGTASVTLTGLGLASAVSDAAAYGAMDLGGSGQGKTASTGRATSFGPALSGFAIGTTLEARFAQGFGRIGLDVTASAAGIANAITNVSLTASQEVVGSLNTRSTIVGGLSLVRDLEASLQASGQADRQIGLAGATSAGTAAAADAQEIRLEVSGASEAQGLSVATARLELTLSGTTQLARDVFGNAKTTFEWAGACGATTGTRAVAKAETSLQGESFSANSIYAVASNPLGIFGHFAVDVGQVAKTTSQFTMSGGAKGGIASLGQGRGALDVARHFAGDVDVLGDSTRQISFRAAASARTTSTGETSNSVLEVTGWGVTRATAAAEAAASMTLRGHAQSRVTGVATIATTLAWSIRSEATAPPSAQIRGALSLAGAGQAEAVARGAARAAGLPLNALSEGKTALAADLATDLGLRGETRARLVTRAQGTGRFKVARASGADVQVASDVARVLSFMGVAEGATAAQGTSAEGMASLQGGATAKNQLHVRSPYAASIALPGLAQSNTGTQGKGASEFGVARVGLGEVLLTGTALRGMPLLGASAARITALAAANSIFAPGLTASADNVIQLDFTAEAIAADVRAAGSSLAEAPEVRALWDLGATSIAYRAPPALRRAEPPKYGLSGRLSPSNSGRILRG
ncbi:hypothetical protein HAT86_08835 [Roseovarius gahaiensis]|uniref:Uncharacterized protein n=1 Tax=Roseovarius gahaiensis TaxID=2716691 RepID=A0A967EER6_9RHOB|nr:hypothetical protein [Roseovarius gahaiensis]NHQ74568.1 hypothetical protein [Roseovarius gahaiensis]